MLKVSSKKLVIVSAGVLLLGGITYALAQSSNTPFSAVKSEQKQIDKETQTDSQDNMVETAAEVTASAEETPTLPSETPSVQMVNNNTSAPQQSNPSPSPTPPTQNPPTENPLVSKYRGQIAELRILSSNCIDAQTVANVKQIISVRQKAFDELYSQAVTDGTKQLISKQKSAVATENSWLKVYLDICVKAKTNITTDANFYEENLDKIVRGEAEFDEDITVEWKQYFANNTTKLVTNTVSDGKLFEKYITDAKGIIVQERLVAQLSQFNDNVTTRIQEHEAIMCKLNAPAVCK